MKVILISILLLISSMKIHSQDSTEYFSLTVNCNINNAKIVIDSSEALNAPLLNYKIKEGYHLISIINPEASNKWKLENYQKSFNIVSDTIININFERYYFINSDPFNSKVFVNDTLLGETPLRFYSESPLSGNLTFKKEEYLDETIRLKSGDTASSIFVKLKEVRYGQTNPLVYKDRKTDFKSQRNYFAIGSLGAGALLTGISAIYHKNVANDAYDKYRQTFDRADLDKTNRNDTISLISLIAMQAAIAGLIYFLFFD